MLVARVEGEREDTALAVHHGEQCDGSEALAIGRIEHEQVRVVDPPALRRVEAAFSQNPLDLVEVARRRLSDR